MRMGILLLHFNGVNGFFRQAETPYKKSYCHYEHSRKAMRSNLLTMKNGIVKRVSGCLKDYFNELNS
ncbi:MAG: hypothetical protein IJV35_02145 [Neisseriaceae bacterium]|nr:hypothetical protein [Neisseriaceae bacterium]